MHCNIAVLKCVDVNTDETWVLLGIVILMVLGIYRLRIFYRS